MITHFLQMGIRHDNFTYEYILELHSLWKKRSVGHKVGQADQQSG